MRTRAQDAAARLEREILGGRFTPGTKLPPEAALAGTLGVSRGTLREAVGELQARGFVTREQGRGTYVTHASNVNVVMELDLNESVTSNIRGGGYSPGTIHLAVQRIVAPDEVRDRLAPDVRTLHVIEVRRSRTADGIPISHSIDYVVPDLEGSISVDTDFSGSLYDLLQKVHGEKVRLGYAKIEAAVADEELAAALTVDAGHLLILITQVHMLGDGNPVMYSVLHHRNDAVDLHVTRVDPSDPLG